MFLSAPDNNSCAAGEILGTPAGRAAGEILGTPAGHAVGEILGTPAGRAVVNG